MDSADILKVKYLYMHIVSVLSVLYSYNVTISYEDQIYCVQRVLNIVLWTGTHTPVAAIVKLQSF